MAKKKWAEVIGKDIEGCVNENGDMVRNREGSRKNIRTTNSTCEG